MRCMYTGTQIRKYAFQVESKEVGIRSQIQGLIEENVSLKALVQTKVQLFVCICHCKQK